MNRVLKMKIVEIIRYGVVSVAAAILLASCSSINSPANIDPLPSQEAIVPGEAGDEVIADDTASATITPTEAPTETPEPSPTATARPTEVGYYFENWGNYPMTLDPEDVEKNGAIIPFNPVDNPIEFQREINKIVADPQHPSAGTIIDNGTDTSGYDPVLKRRSIRGELKMDFKIFFFQYKDVNYPFVITSQNGNGNEIVLIEDLWYGKFIDSNNQGNNVQFSIYEDHSDENLSLFEDGGVMSRDMVELIKITDLSWGLLKQR